MSVNPSEVRSRLQRLSVELGGQLAPETRSFVVELIDANELGIALEVMSEGLLRANAKLSERNLGDVDYLVSAMRLDKANVERLRPLVR